MQHPPWSCAIDFGTCTTAVACRRDGEPARLVVLDVGGRGEERFLLPSAVYVDDTCYLTGRLAAEHGRARPGRLARSPKLALGTGFDDDRDGLWDVVDGHDDLVVPVPELCGAVIAEAYRRACAREGGPPWRVRVGHPAAWAAEPERLRALRRALAWAGLPGAELVSEADAAARALLLDPERAAPPDGAPVVVYDLGGGTCDVAVFRADAHGPADPVVAGCDDVGGEEFDRRLLAYVAAACGAGDLAAADRLLEEVVAAKHRLSADEETVLPVRRPDGDRAAVTVTRRALEACVEEPLARTVALVREVLGAAEVAPADVHTTYLVGGSSRVPRVAAALRAELGGDVERVAAPKATVAIGATLGWPRRPPDPGSSFLPDESPFALRGRGGSSWRS